MNVEYRPLRPDDIEQSAYVESVAFYNLPTPQRVEMQRAMVPPEWTVGAFVDGRLVADVRTVPMKRRINGSAIGYGAVGPVACLAEYRRQGHVAKLLQFALERMREQVQPLSGLHTPHDALYARYGWERAEGQKRYEIPPKDARLRIRGAPGRAQAVTPEEWQRLDAIYRDFAERRNGPLHRNAVWWQEVVLRRYEDSGERVENNAFVWVDSNGADKGYVVYHPLTMPKVTRWAPHDIWVRDFVTLGGDAYLGLWEHLLTHDLAGKVILEAAPDDPFSQLVEDPWKINVVRAEGTMIRVVDVERAISSRPYVGDRPVTFAMRLTDRSAPWNEGVWRIEAAEGRMTAERVTGEADVELSANTLAPLFTGHIRPDKAAGVGLLKLRRESVVQEMVQAFAVTYPPFSHEYF